MKYTACFLLVALIFIGQSAPAQNTLQFAQLGTMAIDSVNTNIESAFKDKLAGVKMVGLGEVTHGDKTTFAFNEKMIQYLVTEQNFRVLFMEAPNSVMIPINDFILSSSAYSLAGIDSLVKRSIQGNQAFRDQQMVGLIKWLKDYNRGHADKMISIMGMSLDSKSPQFLLYTYIKPYDPETAKILSEKWKQPGYRTFYKLSDVFNWEVQKRAMINALNDTIKNQLEKDIRESETTYEYFFHLMDIPKKNGHYVVYAVGETIQVPDDNYFLKNYLDHNYDKNFNRNGFQLDSMREIIMANNVIQLSKDNKAIVWAHNYHVSKPAEGKMQGGVMGDYLDRKLGKQYFVSVTDYSGPATIATYDERKFKKLPDGSTGNPTVKVLKSKYNFIEGIIFKNELQNIGLSDIAIHSVGIDATAGYGAMPVTGFDVYVVFKAIYPVDVLN